MNALPDDPYSALGLSKDATTAEIRKVYLKLVVKSHPDKFQDPIEKAKKADEFHKVQQAYELLSNDIKRAKYHEELKLAELRREMGKTTIKTTGGASASTTTFSYNVHNAEPRPSTYMSGAREPVYPRTPSRSYEDIEVEEPLRRSARKPTPSDGTRPSARDDDRRRRMDNERDQERDRQRREKENLRSSHSYRKKTREKERKRGSENKYKETRGPYTEAIDSDEEFRHLSRSDKKSPRSSRYDDEYIRTKVRADRIAEIERKLSAQMASHAQYTEQARMKNEPRAGIPRAATANEASFRHVDPKDILNTPRRSSFSTRPTARHTPEAKPRYSPHTSKDKKSYNSEPQVVVPDLSRSPQLKTKHSEPLNLNSSRKEPSRSKTFMSVRSRKEAPIPELNRAQTWQQERSARRDEYDTSESSESSEDDGPVQPRRPSMPTRQTTTYKVGQQGASFHVTRHEDSDVVELRPRAFNVRPSLNRTGASSYEARASLVRSQSQSHAFAPRTTSPENYKSSIVPERPKSVQQPLNFLYGEQINVASYDLSELNMANGYRRATSERYSDEHRSRRPRGTAY